MSDRLNLSDHPITRLKLTTLRNKETPNETFRTALHELSVILVSEAVQRLGRVLKIVQRPVETPLGQADGFYLESKVVLVPILRAGLGMLEAGKLFFSDAEVCPIGLRRDEKTFEITCYREVIPSEPPDIAIILDPMIATGASGVVAINLVKKWKARHIVYVAVLAAPFGISQIHTAHEDVPIFLGKLDRGLNDKNYIVPGLGDAGDRQFGQPTH